MQPDFMKMAQQAPQSKGMTFEEAKKTIVNLLNTFGSQAPKGPKLEQQIDELARLLASGDEAAAEKHPLMKFILQVLEGTAKSQGITENTPEPQQQGMMQEGMTKAPKNFAGMMKPPGGGMSGR